MKKTGECEQEIEKLKQFLKNHLVEISHEDQPLAQKTHCPEVGSTVLISRLLLVLTDINHGNAEIALRNSTVPPLPATAKQAIECHGVTMCM